MVEIVPNISFQTTLRLLENIQSHYEASTKFVVSIDAKVYIFNRTKTFAQIIASDSIDIFSDELLATQIHIGTNGIEFVVPTVKDAISIYSFSHNRRATTDPNQSLNMQLERLKISVQRQDPLDEPGKVEKQPMFELMIGLTEAKLEIFGSLRNYTDLIHWVSDLGNITVVQSPEFPCYVCADHKKKRVE